ncbi:flagellar hook-associated protein FlgK [Pseudomonas sp. MAG002Y]|uniref:flagellar hook-associated protein FlgK n=1 Tax=Pseudomonas sp. MAG002Y TaxID=2678690 RepID=UPI001C60A0E5|nr:flagellar hook-associated protein FlgK [Pseudomonas sp. MAG002Y]MBW5415504.1 flagellar hook-associated protein FlgK [Pseudomonas sp. MAG002Y]
MSNLISIGLSGLSASQSALSTTGHNITNADTAGYTRQQTVQKTTAARLEGTSYIGTGTTIADVRRIYNDYLGTQVRTTTALNSAAQSFYNQVKQVDSLLSDGTTGVSKVMQSFFAALQTASASPTDNASRQLLLTQAQGLSERFNSVTNQLVDQNNYVNEQLASMATQANKLAGSVAQYNQAIAEASGNGASPNDLLDARDEAVRQLSEMIGVTVVNQDGNYNLYIGSGQPLVVGNSVSTLAAGSSQIDPARYAVTLTKANTTQDVSSVVTGGEMGGLLNYRDNVLDPARNELGRMAMVITEQVNSQLGQGLDLNGNFGSPMFADLNSAANVSHRSLAQIGNSDKTASLNVDIKDTSKLTTSDYEVTMLEGNRYSVRRLSDGQAMGSYNLDASPAPVIDGFSLSLASGSAVKGDKFTIIPTRTGAADISAQLKDASQLAFAAPLSATLTTGNKGSGSVTQPTLTTKLDVNDATANAQMQAGIKNGTPVKIVFGDVANGSQSYSVFNTKGESIGTGTIVPGNNNKVAVNVPVLDNTGNAVLNTDGTAKTFSFEMTVSGSPSKDDSLTVSFNKSGASDNRNAQQLLNLQTKNAVGVSGGSVGTSITGAYSSLIERVGAITSQAELDTKATSAVLTQAKDSRDSVSGVNLDEEAANLVKFQQYYNASAQVISIARSTFDTLINAVR